jgi:predicted AAA+ superfamily ATPase
MIPRLLQHSLASAWKQFPVVVLTGSRQVGKTTLARHFLPEAAYVTLDVPAEAELARLNPAELFGSRPAPLILDEVQYAPTLLRELKTRVDRHRAAGQYLVTGSQSFELMAGVSESLAGRAAILTLPALSLRELADINSLAAIDAVLWRGSYPQLWQQPELDRELWLGSYVATYLERDVRNLLAVGSLRDFDRFLRACALRVGQLLSYAELARDVGVAPNTAKSWISVLETSQQIFLLEPYHRARTKRLVKSPKLYFCDSGLLTYLMGFAEASELPRHALWGAVWENFVVSEIRKSFLDRGMRPPLWLWRPVSGEELDVLIELAPERFIVVECKTAAQVNASELRGLRSLQAEYGTDSVAKTFVVCRTQSAYPLAREGRIEAVPLAGRGGLLTRKELAGRAC